METWDANKNKKVQTPKDVISFLKEIECVCKNHGYSIAHEDGHGAFEIENYSDGTNEWLQSAHLRIKES